MEVQSIFQAIVKTGKKNASSSTFKLDFIWLLSWQWQTHENCFLRIVIEQTYDRLSVGRLPCAVFQRNRCTLCEKDMLSEKFFVVGRPKAALSASKLILLHGPKGGSDSRKADAIHVRSPDAQVGCSLGNKLEDIIAGQEQQLLKETTNGKTIACIS